MGFITCVFSLPINKALTILKSKEIMETEDFGGKELTVLTCLKTEQQNGSHIRVFQQRGSLSSGTGSMRSQVCGFQQQLRGEARWLPCLSLVFVIGL